MILPQGTNNGYVMFDSYGKFIYRFELHAKWERYFWRTMAFTDYYKHHNHFISLVYKCSDTTLKSVYKIGDTP